MKIFKYVLDQAHLVIEMPKGAKILAMQKRGDVPCIWAQVDEFVETETRAFHVLGTGHSFDADKMRYIGTFQAGAFVGHVFEALS